MKKTLIDLFEESVCKYPSNTFLLEKTSQQFEPTTYLQVREQVYALGAGLVSMGVRKGNNMALLSEGRNAWIIGELAMFYAGACNVPLSIKLEESNDLLFRLTHAEVKYIMVSGNQLKKIRAIIDQLPLVEKIIVFDAQPEYLEKEILLQDVQAMGKDFLKTHPLEEFLSIGQSLNNNDFATITYTSGTTADPKGVILTHRNYTANVEQSLRLIMIDETWRTLLILPLDHCFAHVVGFYIFMSVGASVATVQVGRNNMETLRNIPANIKEFKPHVILSVPALAKSFRKNIEQGVLKRGKIAMWLFKKGLTLTYVYNGDGHDKGQGWRFLLKPMVSIFDSIIFSKVRQNFGGSLRFFVGGGALLAKDLQRFFYALGIPMYQGYGLSEATPVISSNAPHKHSFGSSGMPAAPIELKICDNKGRKLPAGEQGEIVIRGENVMAGYWKNPVRTAETIRNGWLHTGDMGYIGSNGFLYVKGRFKSLLIGSDGEKYSPEGIEEAIVEHSSCIDQLMLYNNQNAYTVALIVPNKEQLKAELRRHQLDFSSNKGKEAAIRIIHDQIGCFKKGGSYAALFPHRWLPTTFAILPEPFTEQNLMINSTMKMVRHKIEKTYEERINFLFTSFGKDPINPLNKESL